jgi:transcriptional regulator with XRE-family HTH domain
MRSSNYSKERSSILAKKATATKNPIGRTTGTSTKSANKAKRRARVKPANPPKPAANDPGTVSTPAEKGLDKAIGKRVKAQRMKLGMSQTKLGDACGITFQQIQKYENGSNRIGGSRLITLGKALKCSAADLLDVKPSDADVEAPPRKVLEIMKSAAALDDNKQTALLRVAKALAA